MATVEFNGLTKYSQHFIVHNSKIARSRDGVTDRLDFLAKMR